MSSTHEVGSTGVWMCVRMILMGGGTTNTHRLAYFFTIFRLHSKGLDKNPLSGWKIIVLLCITIATSMYERWILHLFRKKLVITIYNSFFKRCSPSIDSSYAKITHWCILGTKIWNSSWEHHLQWNNQIYSQVTIDFIFIFCWAFLKFAWM